MRIVSLLPSATEMIYELGLGEQLVGVTHECDYPPSVTALPKVTHTLIPTDISSREIDQLVREKLKDQRALYSLNLPILEKLAPDLIVTQALCDVCAVAEAEVEAAVCQLRGPVRVVNCEPTSLSEVFASLEFIAKAAGVPGRGDLAAYRLQERVNAVAARSQSLSHRPRVVLLEWLDPPFSCGHWSPEIVWLAGGVEVIGRAGERSRTLKWEEVIFANPEVLIIACCGFSIERTLEDLPQLKSLPHWNDIQAVKTGRIYLVDGSAYFSRPGPRLVESLEILASALHPDLHPLIEKRWVGLPN